MAVDALAPARLPSADPLGLGFEPLAPPQFQGTGDMFERAMQEYPILRDPSLFYKFTPRAGHTLETWPPGESGTPESPRPKEFPIDAAGVEAYSQDVPSIDILGDAVSHHLRFTDPVVKQAYEDFQSSLTPMQVRRLREQHDWYLRHTQEDRPYEDWLEHSGLPGYFRGYLFKQWWGPPEELGQWYTPEQIKMFNDVRKYLGIQPGAIPRREEGEL